MNWYMGCGSGTTDSGSITTVCVGGGVVGSLLSPVCSGSDLVKVFHDQNVSLAYGSKVRLY